MNGEPQGGLSTMGGGADEMRLALSMAATTAERRARPMALVLLALLVLLASVIYASVQYSGRRTVFNRIASKQNQTREVRKLIDRIAELRSGSASAVHAVDNEMASKLEQEAVAKQFTMPIIVEVGTDTPVKVKDKVPGVERAKFRTQIKNGEDPLKILEWLAATANDERFDGLEISSIAAEPSGTLESGYPAWTADITFFRWERRR